MRTVPFALTCMAAAAALALPLAAQAQLSFNLGAVSLYKYNGIDQDTRQGERARDVRPALQGGVDYAFGNGFYIGNWNSPAALARPTWKSTSTAATAASWATAWASTWATSSTSIPTAAAAGTAARSMAA